jgi:chromosomal replication initiation ATPase DnaA
MNYPTITSKIIRPSNVIITAAKLFDKPQKIIRGSSRRASVVAIRDLCFKVCKDHLFMSDREIALAFGKERSSVTIALMRVNKNLAKRNQYQVMLAELEKELEL